MEGNGREWNGRALPYLLGKEEEAGRKNS